MKRISTMLQRFFATFLAGGFALLFSFYTTAFAQVETQESQPESSQSQPESSQPQPESSQSQPESSESQPESSQPQSETQFSLLKNIITPECITPEQLCNLIEQNQGGTVKLTGNINWNVTDSSLQYIEVTQPTTVDMGDFGITIDTQRAYLNVRGPINFVGAGTNQPLFTLLGDVKYDIKLSFDSEATVTTTGANATAIKVQTDWNLNSQGAIVTMSENSVAISSSGEYVSSKTTIVMHGDNSVGLEVNGVTSLGETNITAYGKNSVAVKSNSTVSIEQSVIIAEAQGSVAVESQRGVHVWLSEIKGEQAAVTSSTNRIFVDYSSVSPMPASAKIVERVVQIPEDFQHYGIASNVGESLNLPEVTSYMLVDKNGILEDQSMYLPIKWDVSTVNTGVVGDYSAVFTAQDIPEEYSVFEFPSVTIPVHIIDPSKLFLYSSRNKGDGDYEIDYYSKLKNASEINVYSSSDAGQSWQLAKQYLGDDVWSATYGVKVSDISTELTYWFKVEVVGGSMEGVSNVLQLLQSTSAESKNGDRSGLEWDNDSVLPPQTPQTPDTPTIPTEPQVPPPATVTQPDIRQDDEQTSTEKNTNRFGSTNKVDTDKPSTSIITQQKIPLTKPPTITEQPPQQAVVVTKNIDSNTQAQETSQQQTDIPTPESKKEDNLLLLQEKPQQPEVQPQAVQNSEIPPPATEDSPPFNAIVAVLLVCIPAASVTIVFIRRKKSA